MRARNPVAKLRRKDAEAPGILSLEQRRRKRDGVQETETPTARQSEKMGGGAGGKSEVTGRETRRRDES